MLSQQNHPSSSSPFFLFSLLPNCSRYDLTYQFILLHLIFFNFVESVFIEFVILGIFPSIISKTQEVKVLCMKEFQMGKKLQLRSPFCQLLKILINFTSNCSCCGQFQMGNFICFELILVVIQFLVFDYCFNTYMIHL